MEKWRRSVTVVDETKRMRYNMDVHILKAVMPSGFKQNRYILWVTERGKVITARGMQRISKANYSSN